ncbi:MAG: hypothetical protein J6Y23_14560, partial [Prevotella sp.]|nr:hypothetical protein [Prevotella sp.]
VLFPQNKNVKNYEISSIYRIRISCGTKKNATFVVNTDKKSVNGVLDDEDRNHTTRHQME